MKALKSFFLTLFFLHAITCIGQVINNEIKNRVRLMLDSGWHTSSTDHSNVEWDCINKALTNKCLIYHNDQWFSFKPPHPGPLFINVANQRCKDQYGVQLVIIEGDPCKTDSYQLKKCIPFTDQSDFFVRLDGLDFQKEYLVNIDGYMGDRCYFDIEFSSTFKGIPVDAVSQEIQTSVVQGDSVVTLKWTLPDSLITSVKEFELFKKQDKDKIAKRVPLPLNRNSIGLAQREYMIADTIQQKGKYVYSIYGITETDVLLLAREQINYPVTKLPPQKSFIGYRRHIEYFVRQDGNATVQVLDAKTQKKLFSTTKRSVKGRNIITLDFSELTKNGVKNFTVIVKAKDSEERFKVSFE